MPKQPIMTGLPTSLQPRGPGVPGRPKRVGKHTLLPVNKPKGWEHNDPKADMIKLAEENYMDEAGKLPPRLRPVQSKPLLDNKNRNISRGFKNPKGGRTI